MMSLKVCLDVSVSITGEESADVVLQAAKDIILGQRQLPTVQRTKASAYIRRFTEKDYSETPYPSTEYRLLALCRLWNVVHFFFPYKHLMDRDWDDILLEFITKVESARDALDYALSIAGSQVVG
jgi:hypothetical protein